MAGMTNKSRYDTRAMRDSITLVIWIFVWMASLTVADKAALYGWWQDGWITQLAIAINVLFGLIMMVAFKRMLSRMDDLQRKIQMEALSFSLGISLVGCAAYSLMVTWGYIVDEEVSDIFVLMCVSYSVGALFGVWRYR